MKRETVEKEKQFVFISFLFISKSKKDKGRVKKSHEKPMIRQVQKCVKFKMGENHVTLR